MQPLEFLVPLDALEVVEPYITHVILVLVLANMVTRLLAHSRHAAQADDGDDGITRFLPHTATTVLLILSSFVYLILHPHGGMVTSALVLGVFVTDFFEFEARKVEARNDMPIERPKSAIVASVLLLLYAGFQSLFFLVKDYWQMVV
jgi:hypothetical protein